MTPLFAFDVPLYEPRWPAPRNAAPPYNQSTTGAFFAFAGPYTLRYRQSSDCTPATPPPLTEPSLFTGCGQGASFATAARWPGHGSGCCEAFQRNSPTGGFAYGTPRNTCTPSRASPTRTPESIVAVVL